MQETLVSVSLLALLMIILPALFCGGIIALIERKTPHRVSAQATGSTWLLGTAAAIVSLLISAFVLGLLPRAVNNEDIVAFALPIILIILLPVGARFAHHQIAGPLGLALGGAVGCALYYCVDTLITGLGDGSGLWSLGILYAWVFCGIPLLVVAILYSAITRNRAPQRA
ncbi:hypothetical protein [Corynebacterium lowii]|uniref:Uncharacterized protein n=1 Tax=Corynebacterium lowii TaxID=1544413 RepID=A0A0Q0UM83_9CORY|nr:hypothetical protein [Corynebacterium lowii]KQB87537.1 hypothetical protein Clow_00596 [Corynebacterium lowii]MDP9851868.1 ABC-type multidrug transport system permease subunit [Corynebacterium lowii]